jgi:diadenosine tetraphosphate (Ap4A) HIT family hydrolase
MKDANCALCQTPGGRLLWQDELCRVVEVDEPGYPGFCRVIFARHVREMTDLPAHERRHLMEVVFAVEFALRELMHPDKVNLATLGNMTPHLHWHVIPRWVDDPHFPQPIWGGRQRDGTAERAPLPLDRFAATVSAALSRERSGDL